MTNDLAVKQTGEMAIKQAQDDWGLVLSTATQSLSISCAVGQPSNKTKKAIGMFNFSNPEWKPQEKLTDVVIVHPGRNRVLYGKGFSSKRRCGSDNYIYPSKNITEPVSEVCAECFLSKWDSALSEQEKEAKRKWEKDLDRKVSVAPLCNDTINLVVVDQRQVPFSLKFQKTQLKIVEESLINRIRYKGKRPYQVMFDISLYQPDGASYYEYKFENFREVEDPQYEDLFNFFKVNGEELLSEQHAEMDREKDVSEVPF